MRNPVAWCEIYVQDSAIRYLAPVWQDFEAVAQLDEVRKKRVFLLGHRKSGLRRCGGIGRGR